MAEQTTGGQPQQGLGSAAAPATTAVPINPAPAPVPTDLPVVDAGVLATPLVPEIPAMQQQPPGVEVVIAGQRMMVAPEIAVALETERANAIQAPQPQVPAPSLADDLGIQAPSVASPVAPAEPVPQSAPAAPQEDELTEMMFADPMRYHQVLTERIISTVEEDLTKKYTAQRNVDKFNDRFYAANPHLRGYEGIVNDQLVANFEAIKNLPTDQAIAVLTEKANTFVSGLIQRYTGAAPGTGPAPPAPQPVPRTIAAGGTGPVAPQVPGGTPPDQGGAPTANPEVASMSDFIRARKKLTYGT